MTRGGWTATTVPTITRSRGALPATTPAGDAESAHRAAGISINFNERPFIGRYHPIMGIRHNARQLEQAANRTGNARSSADASGAANRDPAAATVRADVIAIQAAVMAAAREFPPAMFMDASINRIQAAGAGAKATTDAACKRPERASSIGHAERAACAARAHARNRGVRMESARGGSVSHTAEIMAATSSVNAAKAARARPVRRSDECDIHDLIALAATRRIHLDRVARLLADQRTGDG